MNEIYRCGDAAALVGYLYDDCEAAEREAIEAHVARCTTCTQELASLATTRGQLQGWTPPAARLGFQVTPSRAELAVPSGFGSADDSAPPRQDAAWWRQPLPAWAQLAAAVVIFTAGLLTGAARQPSDLPLAEAAGTTLVASAVPASPQESVPAGVSFEDLAGSEERLRAEMSDLRTALAAQARTGDQALLKEVESLVLASEARQRREFVLRTTELARDFDTQRRLDLAQMQRAVGQIQGVTGAEVRQHREAITYLINNASQRR